MMLFPEPDKVERAFVALGTAGFLLFVLGLSLFFVI
jgi:hypothetical protein